MARRARRAGRDIPVPRRYVEQALALGPDLLAGDGPLVVVHGDLHYANVMADAAGEWLAIDPKPMAGDAHYEPAPMLWNRMDELTGPLAVGSVRDGLRRRFHALVDAAGLDEDRARDWVVVRMVVNAGWTVQDARRADRPLDADERTGSPGASRSPRPCRTERQWSESGRTAGCEMRRLLPPGNASDLGYSPSQQHAPAVWRCRVTLRRMSR